MIGIIGSGNVGANTAFFLAEKGTADVRLYDIRDGVSAGKALDMMEAAPIRGYRTGISGVDSLDGVKHSDVILLTAGAVRKPGMKREQLFDENRRMLGRLAGDLKDVEGVVVVVTEPVDPLTTFFIEESGLPPQRVLGLGGFLDSTRLRYLIARETAVSMENVTALVVGRHSDAMMPLAAYCCVSGVPVNRLIPPEKLRAIFDETRKAGGLIVDMARRASAYYGPSAVAADLAEAIVQDTHRIASVSLWFQGQYGIRDVAMSLPAVIGRCGIERVLEPRLSPEERERLARSASEVRSIVGSRGKR